MLFKNPKTELESYIQSELQPKRKLMGIYAGNTRVFNIKKKLTLRNPLKLSVEGITVCHSMKNWIETNPVVIWEHVYGFKKPQVHLAKDSHRLLMQMLQENHSHLYDEIINRKIQALTNKKERVH
jgi:hypothetical protein